MEPIDLSPFDSSLATRQRSTWSRIGLVLLNLPCPGLGLLRLARYQSAAILIAAAILPNLAITLFYAMPTASVFAGYMLLLGILAVVSLAVLLISFVLTWRNSGQILARAGSFWKWYWLLLVLVVTFLVRFTLVDPQTERFHPFYTPADSMAPTLKAGDRFMAQMSGFQPINRGDVIVFSVRESGSNGTIDYVKRVAGLPGDRISLKAGIVSINGQEIARRSTTTRNRFDEIFPGESRTHSILDTEHTFQDDFPEVIVPPGHYFVLGDNRDNSLDSRFGAAPDGFGMVPLSTVKGRAIYCYWRSGVGIANEPL